MLKLTHLIALATLAGRVAHADTHYATDVNGPATWSNPHLAQDAPPNQDCNNSDYASSDAGTDWLRAVDFSNISVPAGSAAASVRVQVSARYDLNEPRNMRMEVTIPGQPTPLDVAFPLPANSTNCAWYELDLTSTQAAWPQSTLNGIRVAVRRGDGVPTSNTLRVKAFRIIVQYAPDCNGNSIADSSELAAGAADCNGNGLLDDCELAQGTALDCNGNGRLDSCDIALGHSTDCNLDGRPDECSGDCDGDGIPDAVEICNGAADCNHDHTPDECDLPGNDCNGNGVLDFCEFQLQMEPRDDSVELEYGTTLAIAVTANDVGWDPNRVRPVVISGPQYGTTVEGSSPGVIEFISSNAPGDCGWDEFSYHFEGLGACAHMHSSEARVRVRVRSHPNDCNGNCQDDLIDIASGSSQDCDGDGRPRECESGIEDCNGNGVDDCFEVSNGLVPDMDHNGVPDTCQIFHRVYCTSQQNSAGCLPAIQFMGTASSANSSFTVSVENLLHPTFGLMIWSRLAGSTPLGGGTLCIGGPMTRERVQSSLPSPLPAPCNGWIGHQWTSSELAHEGLTPGTRVFCQFWSRDAAAIGGFNLTNAVEFLVLP